MIEILDLTKQYGTTTAVDHLTVTVRPGVVTGFLGPNGAGKSTTMRAVIGLDRPTGGRVLVGGRRYVDNPAPLREVGALIDAGAVHPGRRADRHLQALALSNGIRASRVGEVLEMVGLTGVAAARVGGFSLGMRQRLGIAAALLGDPPVVVLDEPVNGLDPDGIVWIRRLLRSLAADGRTVLVSSHLMSEMAMTADHLIILGRGRLLADVPLRTMLASTVARARVRTPEVGRLRAALVADDAGTGVETTGGDELTVTGPGIEEIAGIAMRHRILIHELAPIHASLEEAYMALTAEDVEYRATTPRSTAA
jgi:ABC-2 type transport system ATP-binding protein